MTTLPKNRPPTHPVWLNGQRNWDLWQAMRSPEAREIQRIKPVAA